MPSKILIVEDDPNIIELLTYNLNEADFDVHAILDGADALQRAVADVPDLIILDLLLPKVDGLELGADDYIAKPFSPREVYCECVQYYDVSPLEAKNLQIRLRCKA